MLAACGDRERPSANAVPPRPSPALRLVALTDLAGALEPCGCQSRPLGGLDKAATKLAALRADKTPTLVVAAGDLWFGAAPAGLTAGADASTQEVWKAETLNQILGQLGLAAAVPGPRDLSYGPEVLAKLSAAAPFRVLPSAAGEAAKLAASSGAAARPVSEATASWLTTVGTLKVGLVGVSTLFTGPDLDPARQKALIDSAQQHAQALRQQGAQLVIALLSTDQRLGRRLAGALAGVDFVVQGGLDSPDVPAPSRAGHAVILRAAHNGRGLLVVDLYPKERSSYVDISDWTRREQTSALNDRIGDLKARIATWERDAKVDKASLEQQRAKLAELETESKQLERPREVQSAAFDARFEELSPDVQDDAHIGAVMGAYDSRINDHNRVVFADLKPPPVAAGAPAYVGAQACQGCHAAAYAWWTKTPHGNAYATLESRHKQFNLSCVGCHVTGYDKPGGAAIVQNTGLVNVGCESCHGPGSAHLANPAAKPALVTRAPQASVCLECHTPEHSDQFEWSAYRARMVVPGHGLPPQTP